MRKSHEAELGMIKMYELFNGVQGFQHPKQKIRHFVLTYFSPGIIPSVPEYVECPFVSLTPRL